METQSLRDQYCSGLDLIHRRQAIMIWLIIVAAFVVAMILIGGATRLTDSGLSITEWRPVTGSIPPMSEAGWEAELEKYRQIPEYQIQNRGMTMAEFQFIYWWEWGHRQLGRTLGLVFAIPFAFFMIRGWVPKSLQPRLWILFGLGGLQGAIGWWMVSSGLIDRLDVSQYRLATHLTMAFAILGLTVWTALDVRRGSRLKPGGDRLAWLSFAFWCAVLLQIALGAFVAGLDAGRIYTTWPLMHGQLIPDGYLNGMPFWQAIFESRPAVQLQHRWFAYLITLAGLALAWRYWRIGGPMKLFAILIPTALILQVILGIMTLVHAAPLNLSLPHQAGAIALFVIAAMASWTASGHAVTRQAV